MKTVQITVSADLRDDLKTAKNSKTNKGGKTWEAYLRHLMNTSWSWSPVELIERLESAVPEDESVADFIMELLDDRDAAKQFTAGAMKGDVDLDDPPVLFLGEELTNRLNEARGETRVTDFIGMVLDQNDEALDIIDSAKGEDPKWKEPFASKAWEAPLGMVSETEAVDAVVAALGDDHRVAACHRIGPGYTRNVARVILGLGEEAEAVVDTTYGPAEPLGGVKSAVPIATVFEEPPGGHVTFAVNAAELDARAELDGVPVDGSYPPPIEGAEDVSQSVSDERFLEEELGQEPGGLEGLLEKDLE